MRRHLPFIGSALVGLALVPMLYLGLAYRRGQTLSWAPRWMIPAVEARMVRPPKLTQLVLPDLVRLVPPPKSIQARAGKLK